MDAATKCHQTLGVGNLSMICFAPLKTKMEPVFTARILMIAPHKGKKHPPVHISLSTLHRDLILGILPFFWLQICVNSVPNRGFWEVFNMNGERD